MQITEVRIKLMDDPHDRLQAFCSITLDSCFVIRDLKIIQGTKGPFVAMPSRKLSDRCPRCHAKNHLRALYCSQCGVRLGEERAEKDEEGRAKLYADIAHPINSECREMIQKRVLQAYDEELIRAQQEGYVCTYDDYDYDEERVAQLHESEADAPSTVGRAQGASHRVEQPSPPSGPHRASEASRVRHSAAARESSDGDNDEFGAGLV